MATKKRTVEQLYASSATNDTDEDVFTEDEEESVGDYDTEDSLFDSQEEEDEDADEKVGKIAASLRYRKSTDPNAAKAYMNAVLDQADEICSRVHKNQRCKNAFVDFLYSVDRYENTYADQLGTLSANAHYRKCLDYIKRNAQSPDMRASAEALLSE